MFYINALGQKTIRSKILNATWIIYISIPFNILILLAFYVTTMDLPAAFYIIGLPYSFFQTAFFLIIGFISLKRSSLTIREINIDNKLATIITYPAFSYEEIQLEVNLDDVKIRKTSFRWYIKRKDLEGYNVIVKGKKFFLVRDFFDEYDEIVNAFTRH